MQRHRERRGAKRSTGGPAFLGVAVLCLLIAPVAAAASTPVWTPRALDPWFVHTTGHFRIQPPAGWIVQPNVSTPGGVTDLVLRGALIPVSGPQGGLIAIHSEARANLLSARSILQEGIDGLSSSYPAFRILEAAHDTTLGGHAAAAVVVMYEPSTYDVYEILIVVVGPEWRLFWALAGVVFSWDIPTITPTINESLATFQVLPAPWYGVLLAAEDYILIAGLVATAAEGIVFGVLIVRSSRRPRP